MDIQFTPASTLAVAKTWVSNMGFIYIDVWEEKKVAFIFVPAFFRSRWFNFFLRGTRADFHPNTKPPDSHPGVLYS